MVCNIHRSLFKKKRKLVNSLPLNYTVDLLHNSSLSCAFDFKAFFKLNGSSLINFRSGVSNFSLLSFLKNFLQEGLVLKIILFRSAYEQVLGTARGSVEIDYCR